MIVLVPVISGLLGWCLEFTDVIHPVEEATVSGGAEKPISLDPARQMRYGTFPPLDQTLRRTIEEQALKRNTSRASVPR